MKLRQLEYFLGIVEHGGFAKAAARLYVAQSAMSTQIRHLEEEVGAMLLIRGSDGIKLTSAGEVVLRHARSICSQVVACRKEVRDIVTTGVQGVVRLGLAVGASRMLTLPLLRRLRTEWPGVSLHVMETLTADLERNLADGAIELGIGFGWSPAPPSPASSPPSDILRVERLYLVTPIGNGPTLGPPIDVAELAAIPLIIPTRRYATRRFIEDELAAAGGALRIRIEIDSLEQALEMVLASEGAAVMLVSTFAQAWRAARVTARPIVGLRRQAHLFLRESKLTADRASGVVRRTIVALAGELAATGHWPLELGRPAQPG